MIHLTDRLAHARQRMLAYMETAGARCTITRKTGESWQVIATDVPVIVESRRADSARIDPGLATANDASARELTLPPTTDLAPGDRITLTAPHGTGIAPTRVLTIGTVADISLAPCLRATAIVEENAVETWHITVERWSDEAASYTAILTTDAAVVTSTNTTSSDQRGAAGTSITGTLIFEPVPDVTLQPRDSVVGIPWATGAFLTRIHPVVGNRLEATFAYTIGSAP